MKAHLKLLFFLLGSLCLALPALAGETVISLDFSKDDLSFRTFEGHDVVELRHCTPIEEIGSPGLPVFNSYVAVPGEMEAVGVEVLNQEWEELPGTYEIYPQQVPLRISGNEIHPFKKNWPVYNGLAGFPEENVRLTNQADLAGVGLAGIAVCPFLYYPSEGRLLFITHIEFVLHFQEGWESSEQRGAITPDSAERLENQVKSLVLNPQDVAVRSLRALGDPARDRDYVIICPSSFASAWESLRAWKEKKGLNAVIVTTDWVSSNHGAGDAGIRAFVQWAVTNWGTEYFLLGGDKNEVSYHTRSLSGDSIPNDTYYSDYDSDWICEVAVGRASVTNTSQVSYLTTKIINYEKNCPSTGFAEKGGLYGFDLDGSTQCEDQMEYISNNYLPGGWARNKVYDSHVGNHETNVKAAINAGQNLINHADHCFYDVVGVGSSHNYYLSRSEFSAFSNGAGRPGVFNSIGCWPGAFDYDCCAERWIEDNDGGGWAALMNSRYGWYNPGLTSTLSCQLQRYFNRSLFSQNHYHIGYAQNDSKNDFSANTTTKRYIFTEMTLFGDPETFIWRANPVPLTVTHDFTIYTGAQTFTVNVKKGGSNVSGALVCVMMDPEIYDFGNTNSSGNVSFSINPSLEGQMDVTVTCPPDGEPYEGWALISSGSPSPPTISSVTPGEGHTSGGTEVTINGLNFTSSNDTQITFDGADATDLFVFTSTQLTCSTPAHSSGQVDVGVTTSYGSDTFTNGFDYIDYPPEINFVNPSNGPLAGGTSVAISGSYFVSGTQVHFGANEGTGVTIQSGSSILCTVPAGNDFGPVDVTVSNVHGSNILTDGFLYDYPPPEVTSVDPNSGPIEGGTFVTVHGNYFTTVEETTVYFGIFLGYGVSVVDSSTITCYTSMTLGPGPANVGVINPNGEGFLADGYWYYDAPPPVISSIDPDSGPLAGGTEVTLQGENFTTSQDTSVTFGSLFATGMAVQSSTTLTCVTPAGVSAEAVDVEVITSNGNDILGGGYTYIAPDPPTVSDVSPDYGHILGGTLFFDVTITGANFTTTEDTTVTFGGIEAPDVSVLDSNTLTCSIPPHAEGVVPVQVTNSNGMGEKADAFTYLNTPCLYFLGGTPSAGQNVGFEVACPARIGEGVMLVANDILERTWIGPPYNFWVDISLVGYRTLYQTITNNLPKLNEEGRTAFIVKFPGFAEQITRFQAIVGHLNPEVDLEASNYLDF